MITNQKVVQSFNREDEVIEQFDEINERLGKCSLRATFFSSLVNPSTRVVNNIVYAGVALTGGLSVIRGGLTVGQLTIFLSYANQYTKPFNEISGVVTELQNALACAARLFELIEQEAESECRDELGNADGEVDIEDVSFSYVEGKKLIEDYQKMDPEFGRVSFKNVCVKDGEIYIRYFLPKKDGEKEDTPMLIALDKNGKELRRYEGVKELPRGWAVTENYVIHSGSKGDFRVYDRKTAKLLGEAKIEMRPFVLWTKTGNDVIVFDDRAKKLYRRWVTVKNKDGDCDRNIRY
jgi:hypothetical protein